MDSILAGIFMISALVVTGITFMRSVSRTKSGVRWLKGYKLNCNMSEDDVLELLNKTQYPQKEVASKDVNGGIIYKTKQYSYTVDISYDENGYTTIGLLIDWGKLSKAKSKKVAFDWDNSYQFLKQEIEGKDTVDAMKIYKKNQKMQKILNIASVVCLVCFLIFMVIS